MRDCEVCKHTCEQHARRRAWAFRPGASRVPCVGWGPSPALRPLVLRHPVSLTSYWMLPSCTGAHRGVRLSVCCSWHTIQGGSQGHGMRIMAARLLWQGHVGSVGNAPGKNRSGTGTRLHRACTVSARAGSLCIQAAAHERRGCCSSTECKTCRTRQLQVWSQPAQAGGAGRTVGDGGDEVQVEPPIPARVAAAVPAGRRASGSSVTQPC